jgi:hypothetical protein
MPRQLLFVTLIGLCFVSAASAQEQERPKVNLGEPSFSDLQPNMSPELWLYSQQVRRHDDPAQAVRRNAEQKAAQRTARLNAMHWFGYSNSRPQASGVPFMSVYSPVWTGNGYNPYNWAGGGYYPW